LDAKRIPLKKTHLYLLAGCLSLAACTKEAADLIQPPVVEPCQFQTVNPAGRSYASDSVVSYTCTEKHCGLMPLCSRNYWVYLDSVYTDGVFTKTQLDTLRFTINYKSLSDGLTWWESNINIGLPSTLYANDSAFYDLANRMFTPDIKDVRKDYLVCAGDSLKYLSAFEDMVAIAKSIHYREIIITPAGSFDDNLYFEKSAPRVRKDQVYFKPGIGVLKYTVTQAPPGSTTMKLSQVSTLIKYHLE
jgi:hypothetical protein